MMEHSTDNGNKLNRTGTDPGEEELDRLIEETEDAIRNTRLFLDHLRASEQNARALVDSMKQRLEKDLRVLRQRSEPERT